MVQCRNDLINAYWAELQGIHPLLVALEYFCTQWHITSEGITIRCDNQKGALEQAQWFHEQVLCAQPHVDLIWAIMALCIRSKITTFDIPICPRTPGCPLPIGKPASTCMTQCMDWLFGQTWTPWGSFPPTLTSFVQLFTRRRWYAWTQLGKITSDPHSIMITVLGQQLAQHYWVYKQQLNDHSFHLVHWESLGRAINSFPYTFQMWLSKFASSHSAVATTMFWWKWWDSELCPLCWHGNWDHQSHTSLPPPVYHNHMATATTLFATMASTVWHSASHPTMYTLYLGTLWPMDLMIGCPSSLSLGSLWSGSNWSLAWWLADYPPNGWGSRQHFTTLKAPPTLLLCGWSAFADNWSFLPTIFGWLAINTSSRSTDSRRLAQHFRQFTTNLV